MIRKAKRQRGFTLIELLIVVAIIAILAAIAVPNFLEAQVRAKISRCRADMRSLALAIESYSIDQNRPPIGKNEGNQLNLWDPQTDEADWCYNRLTSPVAYMSSVPLDPFNIGIQLVNISAKQGARGFKGYEFQSTKYYANGMLLYKAGFVWYLRATGPDKVVGAPQLREMVRDKETDNIYDSTNGTTSYGDLHLSNKGVFTAGQL